MAKEYIEKDMRPHEVSSHWKKDLLALMSDFCIAPEVARHTFTRQKKKLLPVNHAVRYTGEDGKNSGLSF